MSANPRITAFYPLLLLGWCSLIYFLSSQSLHIPGPQFPFKDKLLHATAFAIMALLAAKSVDHPLRPPRHTILIALGFVVLFGAADEWHQSFVPGRTPSSGDWLADVIGALAALWLLRPRLASTAVPSAERNNPT